MRAAKARFCKNGSPLFDAKFQLFPGILQGRLARAKFGDVPCEFDESEYLALSVSQRGNDERSPETGTVFADSPTLVFALSLLRSRNEIVLRPALLHIIRLVKHGEVFSKDFALAVAQQSLGTGVPTDDVAQWVQLKNGVLAHTFD
jgi:hypothetical protein